MSQCSFRRAAGFVLAASALAPSTSSLALAGDSDDGPRFCRLDLRPAPIGGLSGLDLRTSTPSGPALLVIAPTIQPIEPDGAGPLPWLRVFGPNLIATPVSTDANGRILVAVAVPGQPALAGATLFAQALTLTPAGKVEASNVAATTFTPGAAGFAFADRSASVPPAAQLAGSEDTAAADLDGDGDPDLVVATAAGPLIFRNDGGFAFTDVTASAVPQAAAIDAIGVECFDADGDGRQDVLVLAGPGDANGPPLPNLLLHNQGAMQFAIDPFFPDVAGLASEAAIADFDRDGDLDVVLANGQDPVHGGEAPAPATLLVNVGFAQGFPQGLFLADSNFQAAAWNPAGVANQGVTAGDVDDDGDADLFFARADSQGSFDGVPGQPNVLLRNDGSLAFTDVSAAQLAPRFSDNSFGARLADLDGDGRLDLVVANSVATIPSSSSGEYYRNTGGGFFVEDALAFPQLDESELSIRLRATILDADLDGDLDVLMALHEFFDFDFSTGQQTGGDDLLFVNQGGAQGGIHGDFQVAPGYTSFGVFISSDIVAADFDVDGDDDLYVASRGGLLAPNVQDRLLENTRQ